MAYTIVFKNCSVILPSQEQLEGCPIHHVPPAVHVPMNPEEIVPEGAFAGVPRLRHVSVESGIRLIGAEAWQNCRQLRIVKLPATVVGIANAFRDCKLLNSVLAPGCRDFGYKAFAECCSLQWVYASEGVANMFTSEAKFGQYLFQGCINLAKFTLSELPSPRGSTLQARTSELAPGCLSSTGITALALKKHFVAIGAHAGSPRQCRGRLAPRRLLRGICFGWDGNEDNRILTAGGGCGRWRWWRCRAVRISGGSPGIIIHQLFCLGGHSNSSMFSWRSAHGEPFSTVNGLKAQCASCFLCLWITMTACLCSLLAVNGLCDSCRLLKSVDLSNANVEEIPEFTFVHCTSLREVLLPNTLHTIRVKAFMNCAALVELAIPPSLRYIGSRAFLDCTALRGLPKCQKSTNGEE